MTAERYVLASEAAFGALAARFSRTLLPGDVVALSGPLGAGKTAFVRAIVLELHGIDSASSPTFTIWNRYEGIPVIHHLDFYRIDDPHDLPETGLDDAFSDDAVSLVEWPERGAALLPARAIRVTISGSGDAPREVTIVRP